MHNLKQAPRVLLINPWIYDFAAYDMWAKPLGLLFLASCLRENGYRLNYLDCLDMEHPQMKPYLENVKLRKTSYGSRKFYKEILPNPAGLKFIQRHYGRYGIKEKIFIDELKSIPRPDIILVTSMMSYWYPGPFRVIELVKNQYPDIPVILGGVYATLCRNHAIAKSGADIIISGEGELEIIKLCDKITGWKSNYYPEPDELDSYPYPAFDLIRNRIYICLLTARGCPYRCIYCAQDKMVHSFRRRSPEHIFNEILYFYNNFNIRHFIFYDDALTIGSKSLLEPVLYKIIEQRLKLTFHTPNGMHIRGINANNAKIMRQAGFKTIRISLETADIERQKNTGGKITNEEFIDCCRYLHDAGFKAHQIGVYLLAGLPGQYRDEVEQSIYFVLDNGAYPYLSEFSPIPGTAIFEEAKLCSPYDIENEPIYQNNSIQPCAWDYFTQDDLNQLKLIRFESAKNEI